MLYGAAGQEKKYERLLQSLKGKHEFFYVVDEQNERLVAMREGDEIKFTQMSSGGLMKQFVEANQFGYLPNMLEGYHKFVTRPNRLPLILVVDQEYHDGIIIEMKRLDRRASIERPAELDALKRFSLVRVEESRDISQFTRQFRYPDGDAPFIVFFDGKVEGQERYLKVPLNAEANVTEQVLAAAKSFSRSRLISVNTAEPPPTILSPMQQIAIDTKQIDKLKGYVNVRLAEYEQRIDALTRIVYVLALLIAGLLAFRLTQLLCTCQK